MSLALGLNQEVRQESRSVDPVHAHLNLPLPSKADRGVKFLNRAVEYNRSYLEASSDNKSINRYLVANGVYTFGTYLSEITSRN